MARRDLYGKGGAAPPKASKGRLHESDPFDDLAATYRQMGRRFPEPYSASVEEQKNFFQDLKGIAAAQVGSSHTFKADSVAGRRISHQGFSGKGLVHPGREGLGSFSARQNFGYQQTGERQAFFSDEWEKTTSSIRNSGFLTVRDKGFSSQVPQDRPWLTFTVPANLQSAQIQVVARLPGSGAVQSGTQREFFVGGGWTAEFFLSGYENMSLRIRNTSAAATAVYYSWTEESIQVDQTLYLPQRIVAGTYLAPQGAYAFYVQNTDANFSWDAPVLAGFTMDAATYPTWPGAVAGQKNIAVGTRYTAAIANSILWFIKPI
tara:strand:+ start:4172 stop:5128 length:957 start_codon:yes stop_codon:yes gene_type:complete